MEYKWYSTFRARHGESGGRKVLFMKCLYSDSHHRHLCLCCVIKMVHQNFRECAKSNDYHRMWISFTSQSCVQLALDLKYPPLSTHLICTMGPLALVKSKGSTLLVRETALFAAHICLTFKHTHCRK